MATKAPEGGTLSASDEMAAPGPSASDEMAASGPSTAAPAEGVAGASTCSAAANALSSISPAEFSAGRPPDPHRRLRGGGGPALPKSGAAKAADDALPLAMAHRLAWAFAFGGGFLLAVSFAVALLLALAGGAAAVVASATAAFAKLGGPAFTLCLAFGFATTLPAAVGLIAASAFMKGPGTLGMGMSSGGSSSSALPTTCGEDGPTSSCSLRIMSFCESLQTGHLKNSYGTSKLAWYTPTQQRWYMWPHNML